MRLSETWSHEISPVYAPLPVKLQFCAATSIGPFSEPTTVLRWRPTGQTTTSQPEQSIPLRLSTSLATPALSRFWDDPKKYRTCQVVEDMRTTSLHQTPKTTAYKSMYNTRQLQITLHREGGVVGSQCTRQAANQAPKHSKANVFVVFPFSHICVKYIMPANHTHEHGTVLTHFQLPPTIGVRPIMFFCLVCEVERAMRFI